MATEWIKCSDRLPEPWTTSLVALGERCSPWDERVKPLGQCVAYLYRYSTGELRFKADINDKPLEVTHWKPLDAPPEAVHEN